MCLLGNDKICPGIILKKEPYLELCNFLFIRALDKREYLMIIKDNFC